MFKQWLKDERGQAMSEYGLLVALLVVGVVAVVLLFRGKIAQVFSDAASKLGTGACVNNNGVVTCP